MCAVFFSSPLHIVPIYPGGVPPLFSQGSFPPVFPPPIPAHAGGPRFGPRARLLITPAALFQTVSSGRNGGGPPHPAFFSPPPPPCGVMSPGTPLPPVLPNYFLGARLGPSPNPKPVVPNPNRAVGESPPKGGAPKHGPTGGLDPLSGPPKIPFLPNPRVPGVPQATPAPQGSALPPGGSVPPRQGPFPTFKRPGAPARVTLPLGKVPKVGPEKAGKVISAPQTPGPTRSF